MSGFEEEGHGNIAGDFDEGKFDHLRSMCIVMNDGHSPGGHVKTIYAIELKGIEVLGFSSDAGDFHWRRESLRSLRI